MNIKSARFLYAKIRDHWIGEGKPLEAHDRLSVVTVAAGLREFAFVNHFAAESASKLVELLTVDGIVARQCSSNFDLALDTEEISAATVETYRRTIRERDAFRGIGIWPSSVVDPVCPGMISLGSALSYPPCCETMDLISKRRDHELSLSAIVDEEGDDPAAVELALRESREYCPVPNDLREQWQMRFFRTHTHFPFVLHTACDECLDKADSPTALLNAEYERLAREVSVELHLMVRWGSRALTVQSD